MKELDKQGYETYQKIISLKTATPQDVMMMQNFTKEYIDPKCIICKTCSAQIRFAFNRIKNWGAKYNVDNLTFTDVKDIDYEDVTDIKQDIKQDSKQDIKQDSKQDIGGENLCECGNPLPDKRYKKCKKCKKNKNK
ncbi:MAG: hypothetical protein GY870_06665 [archaeon]|nr:hypothetical protein [archaeon]